MRRKSFVRDLALAATLALQPAPAASAGEPRTSIRLGHLGKACDAATLTAPDGVAFRAAGLNVHLIRLASENQLIAAVGAGTVDAGSATLSGLLRPLAQGVDARVVAGLHAGCLRVVAPDAIELGSFQNLRGKLLATDHLAGPAMNLLKALLGKNGIDPRTDVTWRVYAPADLADALDAKAVACVAASDPLGYLLLRNKQVEPYLDAADGGFSCGGDIARSHHCFLIVHGGLIRSRRTVAASITRAYLAASTRLAKGIGPASVTEVRGGFVDSDLYSVIGMLSSYDWRASTDFVLEEIELTARDFRRSGLLGRESDPEDLAEHAFADVLHA